ncbi:hypothetical protein EJ06DRAFT_149482 [Trichodelitschia bisporula]|uniref:Zn(2)-C6 fungal-type domain-containing protein n=1 Tax=Trichodelitschia bisporula TaxID=703511 RepID=A0A6G1HNN3_9PEZI|nr:hypothetical protein EJ06DRAFT_149482 [Trichodelitschia bisporula]
MPAKRAHKKSRNGCGICRARRVKCDEVHPECGPCRKHEVRCNYDRSVFVSARSSSQGQSSTTSSKSYQLSPCSESSPMGFLDPPPPAFGQPSSRMLDLQLMNHYTYMHLMGSCKHDPRVRKMWAYDVVQRAVGCDFLMSAILSFSSMHLHINNPSDRKMGLVSHYYFGTSLRLLTEQLSTIGPHNADQAFAASIMIQFQTFMSWKDPCTRHMGPYAPPVHWLEMCQGVGSILRTAAQCVVNSVMKPLLDASPAALPRGAGPVSPGFVDEVESYCPDFARFGEFLTADAASESPDPATAVVRDVFDIIHTLYIAHEAGQNPIATRRRLLTFPNALDPRFIELLRACDPRAMITLAHYFAIMKKADGIWWFMGRPEYEIEGVWGLLDEKWKQYLSWPRKLVAGGGGL